MVKIISKLSLGVEFEKKCVNYFKTWLVPPFVGYKGGTVGHVTLAIFCHY